MPTLYTLVSSTSALDGRLREKGLLTSTWYEPYLSFTVHLPTIILGLGKHAGDGIPHENPMTSGLGSRAERAASRHTKSERVRVGRGQRTGDSVVGGPPPLPGGVRPAITGVQLQAHRHPLSFSGARADDGLIFSLVLRHTKKLKTPNNRTAVVRA